MSASTQTPRLAGTGVLLADARSARKRRAWKLDLARVDDILSSTAVYQVCFAICFVGLGIGAYFYAQWTVGMT